MDGEYTGTNYNLAKAEADKVDEKIVETLNPDAVFVSKQVQALARLTL